MKNLSKNILIGIFVSISAIIIVFSLLYLKPSIGDGKTIIYARFINIENINVGTRVLFAGKPVGEVFKITMINSEREPTHSTTNLIYSYELMLKLDSSIKIYSEDEISINTSGLMGERSIAIIPHPHYKSKILKSNSILYAKPTASIETTVQELSMISSKARDTLNEIHSVIHNNSQTIDSTLKHINKSSEHLQNIIAKVDNTELITNLNKTADNTRLITEKIINGEGSLGKLFKEDDLYYNIMNSMNKVDILLNDINHYGILFHLDKGWQRQRLQRVNFLKNLQTAEEFQNYFDDEMNNISTSLARISMLLKTSSTENKLNERENQKVVDSFDQISQKIKNLNETISFYQNRFTEQQD